MLIQETFKLLCLFLKFYDLVIFLILYFFICESQLVLDKAKDWITARFNRKISIGIYLLKS